MRRLYRHTSTLSLSYAVPIFHLARSATQTSLLPSKAALAAPPAAPAAAPAAPLPALPKHPLVGVHNFRDVGTSVQGVRQQFIFRSGAPLKGSQEDLQYLVGACKVRTMIDLRSDRERELDDERNHVHLHFPAKYDFSQQRPAGDESRRYHTVHLTGAHFVMRLLWESPFTTSVKAIGYAVRGAPEKATLELITSLNGRGLLNLYRMFLDCSQSQICQVIHLFSSPENYPIHYFCSLGKDRTGIITALVLCCCDVDREHICNDYSRSREDVALTGDMKAAMKDTGLSDEFLDSPKEVMHATLAYLDAEFGSPKQYLEKIGVPRATQEKIKAILAQPSSLTNVAMPMPPAETLPSAVEVGAVAPGEIPHHLRAKKAQSTPELYDSAKKERKEKETRQERHERHERERQEKKERRQSRSPPPKLERVAQSTSNLVEVIDDAEVERQAKAQVYVWDPKAHQLNKEKESSKP